jgi:hypothetical protein
MMAKVALALVANASCGRVHFDPFAGADGATADSCTFAPFGQPRRLDEVNSATEDWGAWLSEDGLELLFTSDRSGAFGMYRALRSSRTALFDPPTFYDVGVVPAGDPYESIDGLRLWFDDGGNIFFASRPDSGSQFSNATQVIEIESPQADNNPWLTSDELTIVFNSDRGGQVDLYIATRMQPSSTFNPPTPISALNTPDEDCCGHLSSDGHTLVFASDHASPGTKRILVSELVGGVFQPPVPLDPGLAGTDGNETDPALTRDGSLIVFGSDRSGGAGMYDLYIAERSCQ